MKRKCRITLASTRDLTFPPHGPTEAEDWPEAYENGDEPFFPEDVPSDRVGDEPMEAVVPDPPTPSVLTTDGLFSKEKDGSIRISYEDSAITGLPGCLTTFCLTGTGSVILLRRGDVRTCMIFEKGARHLCDYGANSPVGSITLKTHALSYEIGEEAGAIEIDYSVEICGARIERNTLCLSYEFIS